MMLVVVEQVLAVSVVEVEHQVLVVLLADAEAHVNNGVEVVIPTYVAESAEAYFEIDDSDPEALVVYVTGSNADELAAYAALFTEEAGWSVMEYDGDYAAYNAELGVYVSMVNFGDYISIAFSVVSGE